MMKNLKTIRNDGERDFDVLLTREHYGRLGCEERVDLTTKDLPSLWRRQFQTMGTQLQNLEIL